jgi:hypothetical protein
MMKRIFAYSLFAFLLSTVGCGTGIHKGHGSQSSVSDTGKAVISFTEYEHNFGKVNAGEKVTCLFTFTNAGTSDLVVSSAVASCGCTVTKYSGKPVSPGKTGDIKVAFDTSGRNGIQTKTITVQSNATMPVVILKITTEVININNN